MTHPHRTAALHCRDGPVLVASSAHRSLVPLVTTWGVIAATTDARAVARCRELLSQHLDGVVEAPAAPGRSVGAHFEELLDGAASIPREVDRVVFVEAEALEASGIGAVVDALSWLDDAHAAVVRATVVTDALKVVAEDRVVASIDRSGLYGLGPPQVVRRDVLAAVERVRDGGPDDLVAALLRAGHAVKVLRDDLPPVRLTPSVPFGRPLVPPGMPDGEPLPVRPRS